MTRGLRGALLPWWAGCNSLILITLDLLEKSGTKIAPLYTCFGVSLALEDPGATYKPLITIFSAPSLWLGVFFLYLIPNGGVLHLFETRGDGK